MIVEHNHLIELEELGVLYGRDCIFVDNVVQTGSTLKFKGKINGSLASKIHDNIWIPYELTFKQVIKYSSCELDTFEASRNEAYATCKASFFIIQNSECLKKFLSAMTTKNMIISILWYARMILFLMCLQLTIN